MIIWLASYPRSGNTFSRTLLHTLYGQKTYAIYNDIYENGEIGAMRVTGQEVRPADVKELARHEQVYFVKTHAQPSDSSPAIYLLRDGRDSYVSLAHHLMSRTAKPRFYEPSVLRLVGKTYFRELLQHLIRHSSWSAHTLNWTRRTNGKTFVIRFEDLIREPERWIDEALRALGVPLQRNAGQPISFDQLHKQWPNFFRRGQVGSWRDEMPADLHRLFWRRHGHAMRAFGYLDGAPAALESPKIPKRWWPIETGWDLEFAKLPVGADDRDSSPSVSMTSLGRHGRWGNSVFQYMFIKSFAREYGLECEVPSWAGQILFGHPDRPVTRRHEVVLRDNMTLIGESSNHIRAPLDFTPNRVASLTDQGRRAYLLNELKIAPEPGNLPFHHADLEGLFIVHTHHLAPHRDYIRELLRPGPAVARQMEQLSERLRTRGRTIIGIHIRRGDFDHVYSAQGFEFVAPTRWYLEWLEGIWGRVEDPALLVCTDNPGAVLPHFSRFKPITAESLGAEMPTDFASDYFPDWFLLSQCDYLAVSNSTFSFSAAMLNERCREFVRPNPLGGGLIPFDPWDAQPILLLQQRATVPGEFANRIRIAREAFGTKATWPGIRTALATYSTMLRNRARMAHHFMGTIGLARELTKPAFYLASRRVYGESLQ